MEEARGHVLNHIFVLGGRATFCSRVDVRLVANSHLHRKPQSLLVNSPGKWYRRVTVALSGVKRKNYTAKQKLRLTRCVSLHPGSRSLPSRWLFCLLSHGHWPQLRTHRRYSRQRPRQLNTGAAKEFIIKWEMNGNRDLGSCVLIWNLLMSRADRQAIHCNRLNHHIGVDDSELNRNYIKTVALSPGFGHLGSRNRKTCTWKAKCFLLCHILVGYEVVWLVFQPVSYGFNVAYRFQPETVQVKSPLLLVECD